MTTPTVESKPSMPEAGAAPFLGRFRLPWHRARLTLLSLALPLAALLVAFAIGAVMLIASDADPLVAYGALLQGAFGTRTNAFETLVKAAPILFVALGVTFAFRCSVWNIGSEGQLHMGAIGATLAGLAMARWLPAMPQAFAIGATVLTGFLFGGLYAAFAGVLKARWEVNEVITTIMMNFVAVLFVQYLTFGPLRDPGAQGQPMSAYILEAAQLPRLAFRSRLHLGVLLALVAAVLVYLVLWRTTLGYQVRAVGANPRAARHAGINVSRNIFIAMVISGGLAGLAGTIEVGGLHYRLLNSFSPGYGQAGTIVALFTNLHPIAAIPAAVLFGGLLTGADTMARTVQVSTSLVVVIQGLMVLFVLGSQFLVDRLEG